MQKDNTTSALINLIAEDRELITYRKTLNKITGSVTATILLQQILYWATKQSDPFFKFKAPCKSKLYKKGDSWTEELGFGLREFDGALGKIGTKIKKGMGKKEVLKKNDPKALVLYWRDSNNLTWYSLNFRLLGKVLKRIYLGNVHSALYLNTKTTAETTCKINPDGGVLGEGTAQGVPERKQTQTQTNSSFDGETQTSKNGPAYTRLGLPSTLQALLIKNHLGPAALFRPQDDVFEVSREARYFFLKNIPGATNELIERAVEMLGQNSTYVAQKDVTHYDYLNHVYHQLCRLIVRGGTSAKEEIDPLQEINTNHHLEDFI